MNINNLEDNRAGALDMLERDEAKRDANKVKLTSQDISCIRLALKMRLDTWQTLNLINPNEATEKHENDYKAVLAKFESIDWQSTVFTV